MPCQGSTKKVPKVINNASSWPEWPGTPGWNRGPGRALPGALTDEYRRRRSSGVTWLLPNPRRRTWPTSTTSPRSTGAMCARTLATNLTQERGTGGPGHHTFWLSTIDINGRPHMTAVGAFWVDGRYYFSGGPRSRKIRNIEHDPRCAFGVAIHGYDVALEGRAAGSPTRRCCSASRGCSLRAAGRRPSPTAASPTTTAPPAPARRRGTSTSSRPTMPMRSPPRARRRHPVDLLTLSWRHEGDATCRP